MGNLCGLSGITPEERAAIQASTKMDRELLGDSDTEDRVLKLLLLGTGESGKSTIFKQMQILHEDGFSEIEVHAHIAMLPYAWCCCFVNMLCS